MTDADRFHIIGTLALTNGGGLAAVVSLIAGSMANRPMFKFFAPRAVRAGLAYFFGEACAVLMWLDVKTTLETAPKLAASNLIIEAGESSGAALMPLVGTALLALAILRAANHKD